MKKIFLFILVFFGIINFSFQAKMSLPFEDLARKKVLDFLSCYKIEKIQDISYLVRSSVVAQYFCIGSATVFGFLTFLYALRAVKRTIFEENKESHSQKQTIFGSVLSTIIPGILTTGSLFGYSFSTILHDYSASAETVAGFSKFVADSIASLGNMLKK